MVSDTAEAERELRAAARRWFAREASHERAIVDRADAIVRAREAGLSLRRIARDFDLSHQAVAKIVDARAGTRS